MTRRPSITIRKSEFTLELITSEGTRIFPAGIGSNPDGADKVCDGDCRTPEGEFPVTSIEDSSDWEHEGERAYGPLFLRLDCPPGEGIGIHGTNEPELVGTKSSLGCVRMRNDDLLELAEHVRVGTHVRILA
jgi:lipoprotein-anchoring transpeptidase ErfK/SrfK